MILRIRERLTAREGALRLELPHKREDWARQVHERGDSTDSLLA